MKDIMRIVRQIFWWALVLLVVLLVVSFALKNQQSVDLAYYFGFQYQLPLWMVPMIGIVLGALLGILLTSAWVLRAKQQVSAERRKARKFEREVVSLRSLPLKEDS